MPRQQLRVPDSARTPRPLRLRREGTTGHGHDRLDVGVPEVPDDDVLVGRAVSPAHPVRGRGAPARGGQVAVRQARVLLGPVSCEQTAKHGLETNIEF